MVVVCSDFQSIIPEFNLTAIFHSVLMDILQVIV